MKESRIITLLSFVVVALVWFNAGVGLFYSDGGSPRYVENVHGETVQLFGDGIYANDSTFRAAIAKGTDLVMLLVAVGLLITTVKRNAGYNCVETSRRRVAPAAVAAVSPTANASRYKTKLLHGGFLVSILYSTVTAALETFYNQMFLAYIAQFAAAFFAFILTVIDLNGTFQPVKKDDNYTKTAIFTMIAGCSALVWLMDIIPTVFTGEPISYNSIYTTVPTKIIDIGLIFPTCILGGVMLLQKKPMGYILPPVMLIFLKVIAVTVISQTVFQMNYDVAPPIHQLIGYVGTFVFFGLIAAVVNTRFMVRCWPSKARDVVLE